jgi:Na+/glutamate symporter
MIELVVLVGLLVVMLTVVAYLLGFRMGGEHWESETVRVRSEAARAARQMHAITRGALVAMQEVAERRGKEQAAR